MNATSSKRQVFLQECETKMFLGHDNAWTADGEQARDFENTLNAVAHALAERLAGTQILVRRGGNIQDDVIVPISCDVPATH